MRGRRCAAPELEAPRLAAARALAAVVDGRSLDAALAQLGAGHPEATLVRALVYSAVRHAYSGQALLRRLAPRRPRALIGALLQIALAELRHLATPAHAAVNAAVAAARQVDPAAAGFVNAVLRRFLRERAALEAALAEDEESRWEHPRWLIEALRVDWPEQWGALCAAGNASGPMWLRADARRGSREEALARLAAAGIAARAAADAPPFAIRLDAALPVEALPGFRDGAYSVQDASAQWVVEALAAEPGQRVLDACAAPGGKTAALAERVAGLELIAIDQDAARIPRLRATLSRCHVEATVLVADASDPAAWWDGRRFDRILIDAPCTGTGVIRRHPDIKLLRRPGDVSALAARQRRLLDSLWPLLAPGGRLTYATCSILAAENQAQIRAFCQRTPDARMLPLALPPHFQDTGYGYCNPSGGGDGDGFFWASLQRLG
jgi:16S rRNA (cytosine967-C5)-methyltransferase